MMTICSPWKEQDTGLQKVPRTTILKSSIALYLRQKRAFIRRQFLNPNVMIYNPLDKQHTFAGYGWVCGIKSFMNITCRYPDLGANGCYLL